MTELHHVVANALLLLTLLLGLWAAVAGLIARPVGGAYNASYVLVLALFGVQAVLGVADLIAGFRPRDWLHVLYGVVPFLALGLAYYYGSTMPPRKQGLTLGLTALFTMGLVIRARTTG